MEEQEVQMDVQVEVDEQWAAWLTWRACRAALGWFGE